MGSTFTVGADSGYGDLHGESDTGRGMCLQDAARLVAERFPGGVPALAEAMKVSANTLQHKLNPNNTRHKLTMDEALAIQQASGLPFVLQAMASAMRHSCVPEAPDQSGGNPVEAFMRYQHGLGDFTASVADALLGDGPINRNKFRRVQAFASDVMVLTGYLVAAVAQRVPQQPSTDGWDG
ncbi:phage regulatory CII family protein [Comamonas sp. A7-5]|uniref:phage regulatory CII family protein n=1 Tax=Comamonas sp. A7-5 TaxID=673549 RepID=UPI0031DC8BB0